MVEYAFVLSYEHPRLSEAEALTVLKVEGVAVKDRVRIERVLFVKAEDKDERVTSASLRSATIRLAAKIFSHKRFFSDPISFNKEDFTDILGASKTFGVRALIHNSAVVEKPDRPRIERELGATLLKSFPNLKVDLTSPDIWISALYVQNSFALGVLICDASVKNFHLRRPRKRPSFTPATLHPKIAKILTNLSGAGKGDVLLDPFCGVGGILIEAGIMGMRIVGCDISKRMVYGAKKNLQWVGLKPLGILRADASRPPIKKVDVVVTDPPYGVSASTAGRSYSELYGSLLNYSSLILPSGGRLVLVHPKRFDLKVPEKKDFKEVHSFSIRVHRSLTRIVKVLEKD